MRACVCCLVLCRATLWWWLLAGHRRRSRRTSACEKSVGRSSRMDGKMERWVRRTKCPNASQPRDPQQIDFKPCIKWRLLWQIVYYPSLAANCLWKIERWIGRQLSECRPILTHASNQRAPQNSMYIVLHQIWVLHCLCKIKQWVGRKNIQTQASPSKDPQQMILILNVLRMLRQLVNSSTAN